MRLILSAAARDDFRDIDDWLTRNAAPAIAARTLTQIRRRVRLLLDFPHAGRPASRHGLRILRATPTPFLIIDRRIEVARVRHERGDWQVEV